MRRILALAFACSAFVSFSARADFCGARARGAIGATLERLESDPGMRLGFRNAGGLAKGGVCWWHSRFQRAAWYLADFDAAAPAPTRDEAKTLIRKLVSRTEVVVIPGYRDLAAFSKAFQPEIQSALNSWQLRDAFINQAYIRGLSGHSHFRIPARMKARLDVLYGEFIAAVAKGDVLWLLLQMPGIDSHASLLRAMEASPDGGYRMAMVDSNYPARLIEYVYRPGDLELRPANLDRKDYTSVPYAGFVRDLRRIHRAIARHCSPGSAAALADGNPDERTADAPEYDPPLY